MKQRCFHAGWGVLVCWAVVAWAVVGCAVSCSGEGASSNGAHGTDYENRANHACVLGECGTVGRRASPISPPVCPAREPEEGQSCALEGLECSYGNSISSYCRSYHRCTELTWQGPENRRSICLSQPEGFCPSEPAPGAACTVGRVNIFIPCEYAAGVGCYCVGNPLGVVGAPGEWECYGPPRNGACPVVLPNLGDGCATLGQFCNYGIVEEGCHAPYAEVYCYQGAWEAMGTACPN